MRLRRVLHAQGLRYRVDYPVQTATGRVRVDVAFPRRRVAIFIDGCFWHGCPQHGTKPQQNAGYWRDKIAGNRARDERNAEGLRACGWTVVRLWEHEPTEVGVRVVQDVLAGPG